MTLDGSARFPETNWTLIERAVHSSEALERFSALYLEAVFSYALAVYRQRLGRGERSERLARDAASEITQEFASKVIVDGFLLKAKRDRGHFRGLVKTTVKNLIADEIRRSNSRPTVSIGRFDHVIVTDEDPSAALNAAFYTAALVEIISRLEDECRMVGMVEHWQVFEQAYLAPARSGSHRPSNAEIAASVGVDSAAKVSQNLNSVCRKAAVVTREYFQANTEPDTVEAEVSEFLAYFGIDHSKLGSRRR